MIKVVSITNESVGEVLENRLFPGQTGLDARVVTKAYLRRGIPALRLHRHKVVATHVFSPERQEVLVRQPDA